MRSRSIPRTSRWTPPERSVRQRWHSRSSSCGIPRQPFDVPVEIKGLKPCWFVIWAAEARKFLLASDRMCWCQQVSLWFETEPKLPQMRSPNTPVRSAPRSGGLSSCFLWRRSVIFTLWCSFRWCGEGGRAAAARGRRQAGPGGGNISNCFNEINAGFLTSRCYFLLFPQTKDLNLAAELFRNYGFFEKVMRTLLRRMGLVNSDPDRLGPQASPKTQIAVTCEVRRGCKI